MSLYGQIYFKCTCPALGNMPWATLSGLWFLEPSMLFCPAESSHTLLLMGTLILVCLKNFHSSSRFCYIVTSW